MNHRIKYSLLLSAVALLAFLPFSLQSQSELTLESLAKQLTALTGRVDAIEQRITSLVDNPSTPTQNPLGQPAQVSHIVDGDTIDVAINGIPYRIRYLLIDTPERGDNWQ